MTGSPTTSWMNLLARDDLAEFTHCENVFSLRWFGVMDILNVFSRRCETEKGREAMKCPNCGLEDSIKGEVAIYKVYPLAKGGSISTGGIVIKQSDAKNAWESQRKEEDDRRTGGKRYFWDVFCGGADVQGTNEEGQLLVNEDNTPYMVYQEGCGTSFRYYPGGKGLTDKDGKTLAAKKGAETEAVDTGEIPAETEAPVEATPAPAPTPVAAPRPVRRIAAPAR